MTLAIESVPPPRECSRIGSPSRSFNEPYFFVVTGKNFSFESWKMIRTGAFERCMAA